MWVTDGSVGSDTGPSGQMTPGTGAGAWPRSAAQARVCPGCRWSAASRRTRRLGQPAGVDPLVDTGVGHGRVQSSARSPRVTAARGSPSSPRSPRGSRRPLPGARSHSCPAGSRPTSRAARRRASRPRCRRRPPRVESACPERRHQVRHVPGQQDPARAEPVGDPGMEGVDGGPVDLVRPVADDLPDPRVERAVRARPLEVEGGATCQSMRNSPPGQGWMRT